MGSLVWADDLTGAAEAAHTWQQTSGGEVRLLLGTSGHPVPGEMAVWDLDLRHTEADRVQALLAAALERTGTAALFFKLDSQLRGPVHTYVEQLLRTGRSVVLVPANPALGRTTSEGEHVVPGAGTTGATVPLLPLFAGLPHRHLPATSYDRIPELLAGPQPLLLTADVHSTTDLELLAQQCLRTGRAYCAGSAAFLGALARHRTEHAAPPTGRATLPPARQLLAVVGSTEPVASAQVRALRDHHRQTTLVTAPETTDQAAMAAAAQRARSALDNGAHAVLTPPALPPGAVYRTPATMAALAATSALVLAGTGPHVSLYLSGGHTARQVLDHLGLTDLRSVPGDHGPVAHLLTPDGRAVLTKPGSYGGPTALLDLTAPAPAGTPPTSEKEPSRGLN